MSVNTIFQNFFKECHVQNIDNFIYLVSTYKRFLEQENSKHNLTRIEDEDEFWNKHVADSLSVTKYFPELTSHNEITILDIGCGAGFPSFILAAAFANLKITAIDSVGKKINFLNQAANLTKLGNLQAMHVRSKEFKTNQTFDIITARAVGEPFKIFKESKKLLKQNGRYILYRTPENYIEDLNKINKLTASSGYTWKNTTEFDLPAGNGKRLFFIGGKKNADK